MKVLFLITVTGHGRGGHFHSLNHIASALGSEIEVGIVSVGPGTSEVLKTNPFFITSIYSNGINLFQTRMQLKQALTAFSPEIIHCFDDSVYNLIKTLHLSTKRPIVLNKCGGPNPKSYPLVENLILFSTENLGWFKRQKKFSRTPIYLIPNRVRAIKPQPISLVKPKESFCFMRIARIGQKYRKSLEDSIRLVGQLKEMGQSVSLFIVGVVQEPEVYSKLQVLSQDKNVTFITDDKFTSEAAKMLVLADAVIATGRGVMEAASLSLPILTPAGNSDIPILINESNYEAFSSANFSGRGLATEQDLRSNIQDILSIVADRTRYEQSASFSAFLFTNHFDVYSGIPKYLEVYRNALKSQFKVSAFKDMMPKAKTLYMLYTKSKSPSK